MPSESLPPDRKDFVFREQKHDRGILVDGLGDGSGGSSSSFGSPSFLARSSRDQYLSPSPRRPFSGHHKQNYLDDLASCGFNPTVIEGERFRSRYSGRNSSGRDNLGTFRSSPCNDSYLPQQSHDFIASSAHRSVADPVKPASSSSSQLPSLKAHRDKNDGGVNDGPHTGLGDGRDRDHSLGPIAWIPLKWSRTGSFSSSTKSIRSESDGGKAENSFPSGKEVHTQSLATSSMPSDEGIAKKPRLGWGQGLMKYEKQKEGPENSSGKNINVQGSSGAKLTTSDTSTTLKVPGSGSPVPPSSISRSSSHALEEKLNYSTENNNDTVHSNDSLAHEFQRSPEEYFMNSEHFNAVSLGYVNSLIADALQYVDACLEDSSPTRQQLSDKLFQLKDDALKALEKTVVDIDLVESELKNLDAECNRSFSPATQIASDTIIKNEFNVCSCSSSNVSVSYDTLIFQPLEHKISQDKFQADEKKNQSNGSVTIETKPNSSNMGMKDSSNATPGRSDGESGIQATVSVDLNTQVSLVEPGHTVTGIDVSIADGYHKDDACSCPVESLNSELECSLVAQIMDSNRETARKASDVLGELASLTESPFDKENKNISLKMKEKLRMHKKIMKFKERALALKYRVFHLLWKEDQHLLSLMKQQPKSLTRCATSCSSLKMASPKHKASARLQFSLCGNLTLKPTKETVYFTSKLLSDTKVMIQRNFLKMPALILDERVKRHSRFITKNGLVEDPILFEKEKALINPWTTEEKRIFLEMLGTFGKDFKKIASFLDHKTTADCVEFYYKNRKSEGFETVKKRLKVRKQWQAFPLDSCMVPPGDKLKHDPDSASVGLLGEVAALVSHSNDARIQQKRAGRSHFGCPHDTKVSFGNYTRVASDEFHAEATSDALTGIGNSISSEGMGSCITTSVDFGEKLEYLQVDRPFPEVTQMIHEDNTYSDEGFDSGESNDWTDEEKSIFIRALASYGRDFGRISHCLGTRSKEQCKIFFGKARKCLALDMICQGSSGNDGEMPSTNEGRSDTDDACAAEMDSAICSNQSCSKMDDFTESGRNRSREECQLALNFHQQTDIGHYLSGEPSSDEVQTTMEKLKSDFLNDDRKLSTINETSQLAMSVEELPISLRNDDSGNPYGALDNGIKEHINALISPMPSIKVESDSVEDVLHVASSHVNDVSKCKLEPCVPDNGAKCKLEIPQYLEPSMGCNDSKESKTCNEAALRPNFDTKGNTRPQETMPYFQSVSFNPNQENQVHSDLLSISKKNQVFTWWHENCAISAQDTLPETSYMQPDDHARAAKQSGGILEDDNEKLWYSQGKDIHQHCPLGNDYSAQNGHSLHILRGYPLHMLNRNKIVGDKFDGKMPSLNFPMKNVHALPLMPIYHIDNGSGRGQDDPNPRLPFVHKNDDSSDARLKPFSQSTISEVEDQSLGTGDFKLFGKILSHPPAIQKSKEMHEKSSSPNPSSLSMDAPNGRAGKAFIPMQTETRPTVGFGELPVRTYGFWDGRKIQMGFPSLSDPALLLPKYPGAPGSMTYHTSKENKGANGLPIHQRPLTDGNGLEKLSQPHEMVAVTRAGRGSTLSGLSFTGCVSDPVAAIRLCYASQTGLLRQENRNQGGEIRGGR